MHRHSIMRENDLLTVRCSNKAKTTNVNEIIA